MENPRSQEEYDVDFDDTSNFAAWRYRDIVALVSEELSEDDRLTIREPRDWQDVSLEIRSKLTDPQSSAATRRLMSIIQPLPRSIATLNRSFISAVTPHEVNFDSLWGLVRLNLKLSYSSPQKLARTTEWLGRLRKAIELFNRCLEACDDLNEPRLAMVEIYDHSLAMLAGSLQYLRNCPTGTGPMKAWPQLSSELQQHLADLDTTIRHVNDITSYSALSLARQVNNISLRHTISSEDHASFPCTILPYSQNVHFYGRSLEMQKIINYLSPTEDKELRNYTSYGRRGVGKSEIALQYAHENPSGFEAIFWIQCETSVSLRQSFTDVAVALNLPGADKNGHHGENHLAVQKWLKLTKRRWLLIFDNADSANAQILRSYWPVGAKGSVLITSRSYYNFMNDANRHGDTVRPFNPPQDYELLMLLLGGKWQTKEKQGVLARSEVDAAKTLLSKLGGLALAIQQAAVIINDPDIGGDTIEGALELFNSNSGRLPERPVGRGRSGMVHSLDTLWNMSFRALTPNARDFLSVLAMLSPDKILIDLFLPQKQSVLNGKLSFIKHQQVLDERTDLRKVIQPPESLEKVIDELLRKELIKSHGNVISIHPEVQEAMNYHSIEDLQSSFDVAVELVYEAFPKAWTGDSLYKEWATCQSYIPHGVHIGQKFSKSSGAAHQARIKPTDTLSALLANCAWYLYEIGDYGACLRLVKTAGSACDEKIYSRYANICNTAGACYFDLNQLDKCRENYEITLQIQESQYADDNLKVAIILHNMGNLETAAGRYDEAMDYFKRAIVLRTAMGTSATMQLGLTYLCVGRLYYYQQNYDEAMKMLRNAEALFATMPGADHFMTFVHYSYGNIELAKNNPRAAKRSYSDALRITLAETPIHAITAAIHYRLGCVEFDTGHEDVAQAHLEKAKAIAEMKSPSKDNGTIARILWKLSKVLEKDILKAPEAAQLRNRAEVARRKLVGKREAGEIKVVDGVVQVLDEEGSIDAVDDDEAYDVLVPIFYR